MYLNVVPYGPRINGVDVAAQVYFQKKHPVIFQKQNLCSRNASAKSGHLSQQKRIPFWLGYCKTLKKTATFSQKLSKTRIENILLEIGKRKKWSTEKILAVHEELKDIILQKKWKLGTF